MFIVELLNHFCYKSFVCYRETVQPLPKSDHVVSFTDADELLRDNDLAATERDEILEAELAQNDR